MTKFEISRKDIKLVSILYLMGEVDAHTAPEFENALKNLVQEKRFKIIVCLKDLQYISSAGLDVFMRFIDDIRQHDGDIKITNSSPHVFRVFELVGYPHLYEFYDSAEEAVENFGHGK